MSPKDCKTIRSSVLKDEEPPWRAGSGSSKGEERKKRTCWSIRASPEHTHTHTRTQTDLCKIFHSLSFYYSSLHMQRNTDFHTYSLILSETVGLKLEVCCCVVCKGSLFQCKAGLKHQQFLWSHYLHYQLSSLNHELLGKGRVMKTHMLHMAFTLYCPTNIWCHYCHYILI